MKPHLTKLSYVGIIIMITAFLSPMSAIALEISPPDDTSFVSSPIDVTVPNSIEITNDAKKTDSIIPNYSITNNSKLGVVNVLSVSIKANNPWSFLSYSTNFNKVSIDNKKFAMSYKNHDMQTAYTSSQSINELSSLPLILKGKASLSSYRSTEKIANMILTLEFIENVQLDSLKVKYIEQPGRVTTINPEHLVITAVYSNGTEKVLAAGDYTLSALTGSGQETVTVTYSEDGITKETTFIVNNPYIVTLISTGQANQTTEYKFGTGLTLPIPSKKGYTFKGWYANMYFNGNPITEITKTEKGNKTFYAKWVAIEYTINYDLDGGSLLDKKDYGYLDYIISGDTITVEYGQIDLTNAKKLKFTVDSYYDIYLSIYLDGQFYKSLSGNTEIDIDENMRKPVQLNIEFNSYEIITPGLEVHESVTSGKYTIEGKILPIPVKEGYTFKGWKEKVAYTLGNYWETDIDMIETVKNSSIKYTNYVTEIPKGQTGDKIFIAEWEKLRTIVSQLNIGHTKPTDVIATLYDDGVLEVKGTQMKNMVSFDESIKPLIKKVYFEDSVTCNDMRSMFGNCINLEYINRLPIGSTGLTNYQAMFENCSSLKLCPDIVTGSIKFKMFSGCTSLTGEINIFSTYTGQLGVPYPEWDMFDSTTVYKPIKLNYTSQNKPFLLQFAVAGNITLGYDLLI